MRELPPAESEFPDPPDTPPILTFPTPESYGATLSKLIDVETPLEVGEPSSCADGCHYFAELIDDDAAVVGALVVDHVALVFQGGALMMLSDETLSESVATGEVSNDLEEAMREILNVQSRCFNDTEGNPHLRTGRFQRVGDSDEWLHMSMHRAVYRDCFGGRTWLLSK